MGCDPRAWAPTPSPGPLPKKRGEQDAPREPRFMRRLVCLPGLVVLTLFAPPASGADVPAEEYRRAAALVRQLADRSYRVRDRASRELLKMGLAAKKVVEEGAN